MHRPIEQDRDALPLYHGGDLAAARRLFPGAPEPWIDLSTGVNPEPYPFSPLAPEVFTRLPEPETRENLEALAAQRYDAPSGAAIVAAPGTQAIIQLLPRLSAAKRVGILGFTYAEYAEVFRAEGMLSETVHDLDGLRAFDVAIVVNPNNPDGRFVPPDDLASLAHHLARKGGLLVVDEAFVDLLPPDASVVPVLPQAGALVLRSFGKTYGLPGVRLGFAVTNKNLGVRVRRLLGPWPISGPAIAIGQAALQDEAWVRSLPQRLAPRAAKVEAAMTLCGARKIGGTPLFQLFEYEKAQRLLAAFGEEGVLLRRFPERPHWLRAGLVAPAFEERLLETATRIAKALG
ncbi:MAG TPA: threonine-phosphate decarboxylase CobD [Methylovirgula sp.]